MCEWTCFWSYLCAPVDVCASCLYLCTFVCVYLHLVCLCIYVFLCTCVFLYIFMFVHLCEYISMCVCVHSAAPILTSQSEDGNRKMEP